MSESQSIEYKQSWRDEYLKWICGFANAIGGNILGNTLSLNYKSGNLTFIPEIRIDSSSVDTFSDSDALPTGSNAYVLLATTYTF